MASNIIVIEKDLLKSKAFRPLSGNSKNVYFDFLMKRVITKTKAQPGRKSEAVILNNGKIEYCYSEAEQKGLSRDKFAKAINQLVENGFIDIAHLGTGGHKGDKSKYAISDRWRSYGTENFIKKTRPKDTRKGRGWDAYHHKKSLNIGMEINTPSSMEIHTPR